MNWYNDIKRYDLEQELNKLRKKRNAAEALARHPSHAHQERREPSFSGLDLLINKKELELEELKKRELIEG